MKTFHFWSQVVWTYWQIKCSQVAWTYLDCHFVLRFHWPLWSPFCAQVAQTYKIAILCSGHMDLHNWCYDLHFALRPHGPILHVWTHSTEGLCICHFVFRPHKPIQLPFCTQDTWTYMIAILCSGCMDLQDWHFVLRSHGPIISYILQCCPLPSPLTVHPHNVHMYHSISCDITNINFH